MERYLSWLREVTERIGADPRDSQDIRLRKQILLTASFMFIGFGLLWGIVYILLGEPLAGLVPLTYCLLSSISIVVFARLLRYEFFRFTQLLMMLLLPFLVMLRLGGHMNSSAVILWSLMAPFGALIFGEPRGVWRWFAGFLALVILGVLLQPFLRPTNNLPPAVILTFLAMNIGSVSATAIVLLVYFVRQKDEAYALLRAEQDKSENLLLNILPKEIVPILKNHPGTIADDYAGVSILFADIVSFTPWSVELAPKEMVEMLNEIFSYFDILAERYGVEKIRTIGDNYMAAAGVPKSRPDHAEACARMALEMRDYIESRPPKHGKRLDFRIGINSGPVIAGVVGKHKFVFDLWGDPVNTAARMESHGVPGKIQIARDTYELIKDGFICEPRGKITVKGKGEMETWYLVGVNADADKKAGRPPRV
jgi:guanylate cyclase